MNRRYRNSNTYPSQNRAKAKALPQNNAVVDNLPLILSTVSVVVVVNVLVVVRLLWGSGVG